MQLTRLRSRISMSIVAIPALLVVNSTAADELLAPDREISAAVDHYVNQRLQQDKITPAPLVDDANFVRRVALDLAGRIPTISEVDAYLHSSEPNKKARLVDRLIETPDFAFHQRNEFEILLAGEGRSDNNWREYLLTVARENRPWNRVFRDIMLADDTDEKYKHSVQFIKSRIKDRTKLTNDVSSLFFGVNISCAQCHDHPLVDSWQQDHFFGMTAFFNRTYVTKKDTLAERNIGEVKFTTTEGVEKTANFMFLTGAIAQEPTLEWTDAQKKADDEEYKRQRDNKDAPPPTPAKYSPRTQFVRLALEPEETSFFARSIANRTWMRLFGLGIVDPPDQLHDDNPGSHPQLLEWLARDLRAHDYDLRRLIRGLVLSDAYARSSRWESEEAPDATYFAVGSMRALTPRQYGVSLFVAGWNPETLDPSQSEEWIKQRERFENSANFMTDLIAAPEEHFQVGVEEVLYFSNNKRFQDEFLRDASDRLVGHLKTFDDPDKQIETAFRVTLSRLPDDDERKLFQEYLNDRQDRSLSGLQQAVWALLTSSELRFNY